MKISASNIGWKQEFDNEMYAWLSEQGVAGLEIAPTRIFPETPYDKPKEAKAWAEEIKKSYGMTISSMQSIWFGRTENIFASAGERQALLEYTKKAIEFAQAVGCGNLVFGCPRNRSYVEGTDLSVADEFFGILGEYAHKCGTVLAMEANPPMYNTNFCNATSDAFELVERISKAGFRINLDMGTIIANGEDVDYLKGRINLVNHVHISEPGLAVIEKRNEHTALSNILKSEDYKGFVSLEIKTQDDIENVKKSLAYIKSVFE